MFCDLVESTQLALRLDPEDLHEVIAACHRCISEVVTLHGGVVARYMGDGALAYFGYPRAHEDDAERAVRAGLQLVEAVKHLDLFDGYRPQIRVGIATGLVLVGDTHGMGFGQQQDVIGETPNLAARLQAAAEPGAVLIAPITRKLVGGLFEYRDLGLITLKGFDQPIRIWRVLGPSRVESRFDAQHEAGISRLVGREEELDLLLRRWKQIEHGGRAVLILGEPGIGKSRMRRAVQEELADARHLRMNFYCSPHYRESALYPIVTQIEHWANLAHEDTAEIKFSKLEGLLRRATDDRVIVDLIAELLFVPAGEPCRLPEVTPERRKENVMEALLTVFQGLSARFSLFLTFEDVHWIDPTSLEFLALLVERVAQFRALLVITARPEFMPSWPSYAHVTTMSLSRLNRVESAALAAQVTRGKVLPDEVLKQVLDRTDGVPLFIEEMTKALLEGGLLRETDTCYELDGTLPSVAIPTTLNDSLMARLDRLGDGREIAQIGAAIGREFSLALISAVSGVPGHLLGEGLEKLVRSELLSRWDEPPGTSYAFKHGLIRDVAYSTLMRSQRQSLHARIAKVLEERFPDVTEQNAEFLAHHCAEAGLTEKAISYWGKAGRKSAARYAKAEAVMQFRRALDLLGTLPPSVERDRQEFELQCALGSALIATRIASQETGQAYLRARELCEDLRDADALAPVLNGLGRYYLGRCELDLARGVAEDLLRLGEHRKDPGIYMAGHLFMGICLYWNGKFAAAKDSLERVLSVSLPEEPRSRSAVAAWDMNIAALSYLSLTLLVLGYPDQASSRSQQVLLRGRQLGPPQVLVRELTYAGLFRLLRRNEDTALELAQESISLATEQRYPFWLDVAYIIRGFALTACGDTAEGLRVARDAADNRTTSGSIGGQTYFLGLLAWICERAKQAEEANSFLQAALDMAERTGERWFEPELHRLKGEWLMAHRRAEHAEAEECFRRALVMAQEQSSKLWVLRAAMSLAKHWLRCGRAVDARAVLVPAYQSFTEGFGTADLRDAKALLDELISLRGDGKETASITGVLG